MAHGGFHRTAAQSRVSTKLMLFQQFAFLIGVSPQADKSGTKTSRKRALRIVFPPEEWGRFKIATERLTTGFSPSEGGQERSER